MKRLLFALLLVPIICFGQTQGTYRWSRIAGGSAPPDVAYVNFDGANVIHVSKGSAATDTRTGLSKYDATKPFATLTAAKTAAVSGDVIVVQPGIYNERNLAKNGVDWYFFPGSQIVYTGTEAGAIFDDTSAYGVNGPVVSKICGYGSFENSSTKPDGGSLPYNTGVVFAYNASSNIYIEGVYCFVDPTNDSNPVNFVNGGSVLEIAVRDVVNPIYDAFLTVGDGGSTIITSKSITASQAIEMASGTCTVSGAVLKKYPSGSDIVLYVSDAATLNVRNCTINGSVSQVQSSLSDQSVLNIFGSVIESENPNGGVIFESLGDPENFTSIFFNTKITCTGGPVVSFVENNNSFVPIFNNVTMITSETNSIVATNGQAVGILNVFSNKVVQPSPTITQRGGSLTVSTDVQ